ncbi:MAG: carboxypeptidase-like regulatory domain-containing protein [Candidatus Muirbacterium halophilum]|nr:carboxypeptidase-like regulatory domain-containing protein [Candidatus Muirbacterium halophilum]MCK9476166.1 carboxypeptidase-like regulatory domain-containing protein [Candidatus Muirbacterium halophilum]
MIKKLFFVIVLFCLINTSSLDYMTGSVSDESNTPLINAKVIIGNYSEGDFYAVPLVTLTDRNGKFRLNNIIPGLQSVEVEKEGYKVFGDTINLKKNSNIFNIRLEKDIVYSNTDFDSMLREEEKKLISGMLIDKVTQNPIVSAYVVFGNKIGNSDEDGKFAIELDEIREEHFIIQARGYNLYQEKRRPGKNLKIILEQKVPYNEIYGSVVCAEDFLPVSGIKVKIGDREIMTDPRGNYYLKNITSGEYPILVENEDYKKYADIVKIYKGKQNYDIILKQRQKYGSVFGYVKNRSNMKPISNALVAVGTVSLKTDQHGFYELYSIPARKSEIVVIFNSTEVYRADLWVQEGKQQYDIIY